MTASLDAFVPDRLWLAQYFVGVGGARINARMTVIRLRSGEIVIHSPCAFDPALALDVAALGKVAAIIAPGNFHWLHVASCQSAFPDAVTYICPGVERRARGLRYDVVLDDEAPPRWAGELSQVALRGTRFMREVAFFHRSSKTLILTDLVENVTPDTPGTNAYLRLLFRAIGMWKQPGPAPEYWLGWGDKAVVRDGMKRILAWDFERVIVSRGDLIVRDARQVVEHAWRKILACRCALSRATITLLDSRTDRKRRLRLGSLRVRLETVASVVLLTARASNLLAHASALRDVGHGVSP